MPRPEHESPPLRVDALRNRERLLHVARTELADGRALQLNDVARKAGVGVGTAYRHFPTPQALLEGVADEWLQRLLTASLAALEETDTRTALTGLLRTTLALQILSDGGLGVVMAAAEDAHERTSRAKADIAVATEELLHRAHLAGVVRRDITASDVRNFMCGLERAVLVEPQDVEARADRYLAVLVDGLRPSSGR